MLLISSKTHCFLVFLFLFFHLLQPFSKLKISFQERRQQQKMELSNKSSSSQFQQGQVGQKEDWNQQQQQSSPGVQQRKNTDDRNPVSGSSSLNK